MHNTRTYQLDYRVLPLESVLELGGLAVIDTSAISTGFFQDFTTKRTGLPDAIKKVEREIGFHRSLTAIFDAFGSDCYFPLETRDQSGKLTKKIRRLQRDVADRANGTVGRGTENEKGHRANELVREDALFLSTRLNTLSSTRVNCLRGLFRRNLEEDQLQKYRVSMFEGIKNSALELLNTPWVLKKKKARVDPHPKHVEDDAMIFAKAVTLSYQGPVRLITEDTDFLAFSSHFYADPTFFSNKYGFPLPNNAVDIVYLNRSSIQILEAGDEEGKRPLFESEAA